MLLANALLLIRTAVTAGAPGAVAVLLFCLVLMILPVGAACWMFPLLSRFDFRPVGLMLTALRLTVGCLPRTLGLVAVLLVSALLVRTLLIPIVLVPGVAAWLFAALLEPVFRRYQAPSEEDDPEDPDEDAPDV